MRSKYLLTGLVILLSSVVVVSGCIGQSSEPAVTLNQDSIKFTTYKNSDYAIKIGYPEDWKVSDNGSAVFLFSSAKGQSINLIYRDISDTPMTLDEYTDLVKKELELLSTDTFSPVPEKTTIDDNPAYIVVYTTRLGNIDFKVIQAWTIKNDKAYVLTYGAPTKEFDKSLGNRIINSFEFTSKAVQLSL